MTSPAITLLTPVYNDEAMVGEFIQSVLAQTYPHWRLVLVNDGSTDATPGLLDAAAQADSRIQVLHQSNQGQQQALLNAVSLLPPDSLEAWVMLAHSDDLLNGPHALENQLSLLKNPALDGLYAGFDTMNETGQPTGSLTVPDTVNERTIQELFLNGGSNPIPDHFFCRQSVFRSQVIPHYLLWNTPYWLRLPLPDVACHKDNPRPSVLRLAKAPVSWYRYRVYGGNYISSDQGRFVMSHGALRSTLALSRFYRRIFPPHWRKRSNGLKRSLGHLVLPVPTPHHERLSYVQQVLKAYYGKDFKPSNRYHQALIAYYSGLGSQPLKSHHSLNGNTSLEENWLGKDGVAFYEALRSGTLSPELAAALDNMERQPHTLSHQMRYFLNLI